MNRKLLRGATLALSLSAGLASLSGVVFAPAASAQTVISGDIAGTITDPTGAALPGAKVVVKSVQTGAVQTFTTGAAGDFRVPLLKPGTYTVTVHASGFQPTQTTATVAVGQITNVNLKLPVASGTQTVQVEASTVPLLQTQNSDLSTTLTEEQVQNMPNPGGDITYPVNITQGVVMNTQGGYGNSSAFGLPATSNNFTINGAEDNDPFLNLNNSGPSNMLLGSNDVGEVSVVANAYSAQYGSLGGVQENITTRSGTNHFHGNVNYFWTNSDLNANDWFNNHTNTPEAYSNANQWAAAVGGPIIKNRAFFFVNYEGLKFVTSPTDFVLIPSASYEASVLNNLQTQNPAEVPFYQKMFSLYNNAPGASRATAYNSYSNSFEATPRNNLSENLVTARFDANLGAKDNMFIHFKWDHGVQPTYVDPISSAFNAESDQPDYEGQLEETHAFSANLVNQFLMAGSWYSALFTNTNPALAKSTFPYALSFNNGSFYNLGGEDYDWPEGRNVTQYQINDDVSWTHNKNTLKFGFTFKRNDVTDADLGIYQTAIGEENGPAAYGPLAPDTSSQANGNTGDSFAQGVMDAGLQNFASAASEPIALYNLGFYVQDQWKVASNFQVTGGIRVEHNSNPVCQTNCFARFTDSYNNITANDNTPYNSIIATGLHQAFQHLQAVTIDPRVGFTWSPPQDQTMVVRGGFGLFTDVFPATFADDLLSNVPLNPQYSVYGYANDANPYLTDPSQPNSFTNALASTNQAFQNGFANNGSYNSISAADPNFTLPSIYNADKNIHYPTYEEWSLQVQKQIGRHVSFQIGYVGNHGYHEPVVNNGVNASEATSTINFNGLPANPALPAFAGVTEVQSVASSNYNGLITSVKVQSKLVTAQFNYTYSHALDEISNGGFLPFGISSSGASNVYNPINPFNLSQNYGNADYDLRHNFNGNYLINIPQFRGPKVLTADWTLAGTIFWHSGFPFSVTSGTVSSDLNAYGNYGGTVLAQVVNPDVKHHCGKSAILSSCFSASDFADPTGFGQQHRNQFTGPGFFDTDLALMKGFKIPGLRDGQFKVGMQAYNILNHANFQNPDFNYDSSTFGTITSTASVPTSVFGSFLGGDASPRILQMKANITF
jgi:hypothetical protein